MVAIRPEAQAYGGAEVAASWQGKGCASILLAGELTAPWSALVSLHGERFLLNCCQRPASLMSGSAKSLKQGWFLTASGLHVNLALLWSPSIKASKSVLLNVRTVLFITFLLIFCPSEIQALYNIHHHLGLGTPASDTLRS